MTGLHPGSVTVGSGDGKREASPDGPADDVASKRKKTSTAGPRGVANLTPEQLAKKRQNDREAQRAIRQRTKEQIESLERRIQELTNQKPYQELLAVQRAKEAVEQENAEIKRRLAAIIGELQPLASSTPSTSDFEKAAATYASPANTIILPPPPTPTTPASIVDQPISGEQAKAQLSQQRLHMRQGLELGPERLGLGFLLDHQQKTSQPQPAQQYQLNRILDGVEGAQDNPRYNHVPMKHDGTDGRNSQTTRTRTGSICSRASSVRSPSVGFEQQQQQQQHILPHHSSPQWPPRHETDISNSPNSTPQAHWTTPIKNIPATCPLDQLLLNFLYERQQRAAEGFQPSEVAGPRYPSVSSLLNPAISKYSHPLSRVFTDIIGTFPTISRLPERVASLYIMFLVMRWKVLPTRENYYRLPDWMRPKGSQLTVPHPAWVDSLPFPIMREYLASRGSRCAEPGEFPFDNFFVPFTTTLSVNWPYEEADTLLASADGEDIMINPVFERHIMRNENWTIGEQFIRVFPTLAGTCNINNHPVISGSSGNNAETPGEQHE